MAKLLLRPSGAKSPMEVTIRRASTEDAEFYDVVAGARHVNVEFEDTEDGAGWLRMNGRILPFRMMRRNDALHIWILGRVHVFELVDRAVRRAAKSAAQLRLSDLSAPMPGTILQINVAPGDAFAAHAPLVLMESMKMEMALSAPHAGRVKEIACRAGQLVEMGAVLIKFEEEGHAGLA